MSDPRAPLQPDHTPDINPGDPAPFPIPEQDIGQSPEAPELPEMPVPNTGDKSGHQREL